MSGDVGDDLVPKVRRDIGRWDSYNYISVTFQSDLSTKESRKESFSSSPREGAARPVAPKGNFDGRRSGPGTQPIDWLPNVCGSFVDEWLSLMKVRHDRVAHQKILTQAVAHAHTDLGHGA